MPDAPDTALPTAPDTALPTAPAYAQLVARRPYLWGNRRLAAGEIVVDLRARGGVGDLKVFTDLLRWSAFVVQPCAGPAPAPAPVALEPAEPAHAAIIPALRARIAELEDEIASRSAAPVAEAQAPVTVAPRPTLSDLLADQTANDLSIVTGITVKQAEKLLAWASDDRAQRTTTDPAATTEPQA
jgi:hypothetical protein